MRFVREDPQLYRLVAVREGFNDIERAFVFAVCRLDQDWSVYCAGVFQQRDRLPESFVVAFEIAIAHSAKIVRETWSRREKAGALEAQYCEAVRG